LTGRTSDEYRSVVGHATSLLPPNTPFGGVNPSVREGHDCCNGGFGSDRSTSSGFGLSSDLLQFQTDSCQTAAKRTANRRFLFIDLALVLIPRHVPRTVG